MRGQETYHKNVVEIGGAWSLRPLLTCEARNTAHKNQDGQEMSAHSNGAAAPSPAFRWVQLVFGIARSRSMS
jgi:hypothetical protein